MKILKPLKAQAAYEQAANIFQEMYQKITGILLPIVTEDDGDDLIVIGSDAVNTVSAGLHLAGKCKFLCVTGSDSYHILSVKEQGRNLLIMAGGRGRSTIYAVYRYFEKFCDCRYFWDGDVIPKAESTPMEGIDLAEAPRFQYRGLRYFAHRSLHRFQAEHWGYEDWKKEINWILKKRLNLFMLRIGNDDIFQKAFPDIVDYPPEDGNCSSEETGYNDRTTAWGLRYRGQLRKKILAYAFDCDLMHPEDCGTITHWYSRTPEQYLEKVQPKLLNQTTSAYKEQTGLVWDIREDDNLNNYFKLTEAHIREYGKAEIFHTIGLAERMYSEDREVNMALKTYAYHRIANKVAMDYPAAKLLIASWDLYLNYTPEEVSALLKTFDPERTILLDYTSESSVESNFTNWDTVGKFPWIFGLFHAYENDTDIRGLYPLIEERIRIAKEDPMCQGFILWPELSHSDTFMLEYMTDNAWEPLQKTVAERMDIYCCDRYRDTDSETIAGMQKLWQDFYPIITIQGWNMEYRGLNRKDYITDIFFCMQFKPFSARTNRIISESKDQIANAANILRRISQYLNTENAFLYRDVVDIIRTILKRYIQYSLFEIQEYYMMQKPTTDLRKKSVALVEILTDFLEQNPEYSLYDSYQRLELEQPVNPVFEKTLLKNSSALYCRTHVYENFKYVVAPEQKLFFEMLQQAEQEKVQPDSLKESYMEKVKAGRDRFIEYRLEEIKPVLLPKEERAPYMINLVEKAAQLIAELGEIR